MHGDRNALSKHRKAIGRNAFVRIEKRIVFYPRAAYPFQCQRNSRNTGGTAALIAVVGTGFLDLCIYFLPKAAERGS